MFHLLCKFLFMLPPYLFVFNFFQLQINGNSQDTSLQQYSRTHFSIFNKITSYMVVRSFSKMTVFRSLIVAICNEKERKFSFVFVKSFSPSPDESDFIPDALETVSSLSLLLSFMEAFSMLSLSIFQIITFCNRRIHFTLIPSSC